MTSIDPNHWNPNIRPGTSFRSRCRCSCSMELLVRRAGGHVERERHEAYPPGKKNISHPSRHFGLETLLKKMIFHFPVWWGYFFVPWGAFDVGRVARFCLRFAIFFTKHVDDGQVSVFIDGLPTKKTAFRKTWNFHSDLFAKKKTPACFGYTRDYTTELSGDKKSATTRIPKVRGFFLGSPDFKRR